MGKLKFYIFSILLFFSKTLYPYQIVSSENIPYSSLNNQAGEWTLNSIAGENQGNLNSVSFSSYNFLSGYLSQIYPQLLYLAILEYSSTGSIFQEGGLFGVLETNSIKLKFTNDISTSTFETGLSLIEISKHSGEIVNLPAPKIISQEGGDSIRILPQSFWEKGANYALYLSSAISDINGLKLETPVTYYFNVVMDKELINASFFPSEPQNKLIISPQTFQTDFFVVTSTNQNLSDIKTANEKIKSIPAVMGPPLATLSVKIFDTNLQPLTTNKPYTVLFTYKDENNDGIVDGTNPPIKVKGLRIWKLDKDKKLWIKQSEVNIDKANKTVSLTAMATSSQDSYALLGVPDTDVSTVYAYPVPFKPNSGNLSRYGSWNDGITFTNLPSYGKIRIYTISGQLVRELDVVPNEIKWDIRNKNGEIVASGIYIWEIVSGNNRKTGKLAIVK